MTESTEDNNKWLTRNVILLGLVSFFADLSGEMMTPVLPLFIVALGGTELVVGFIGGVGDFVANIMKVFSGYLADKVGKRKELILIGYGIPFLAKLGIGLSNSWEQVAVLKPTERLGKGIRGSPRDSLLADSTVEEFRGKVFGFHRTMDTAGAVMGSFVAIIIAILLIETTSQLNVLKNIIIVSAFVSLLAVIPILLLKEKGFIPISRKKASLIQNLKNLPIDYYKFLFISVLFSLANFTILLFVLASKNILPENPDPVLELVVPIGIFIWFSLVYTILSMPFGSWSDKIGRKKVFAIGLILFILSCIMFMFTTDILLLMITFALYGAFSAATDGIAKAYTVDIVPKELKGTGLGLLQTVTGLTGIVAGIIAGQLMNINVSFAFFYGAVIASIALIALLVTDIRTINLTTNAGS